MVDFVVTGRAAEVADILIQIEDDVESGLALTFPGGATKTFATYLAIDNVEMFDEVSHSIDSVHNVSLWLAKRHL